MFIVFCLQVPSAVITTQSPGFSTKLVPWRWTRFCALKDGGMVLFGKTAEDATPVIHHYSHQGELIKSWPALPCSEEHEGENNMLLDIFIDSKQYLATQCFHDECQEISLYSLPSGDVTSVYKSKPGKETVKPGSMCVGPDNTILAIEQSDNGKSIAEFTWNGTELVLNKTIPIEIDCPYSMHYSEGRVFTCDLLFKCHNCDNHDDVIYAVDYTSGETLWKVQGEVEGKRCCPHGMCTDKQGRLYVGDADNERVLVFDARTGRFIQQIDIWDVGCIGGLAWSETQPHLVVSHRMKGDDEVEEISYFSVFEWWFG